jgi:hypothetical protein
MKAFTLSVCLLISGALFILGGCKKASRSPQVYEVDINSCAATLDKLEVHEQDQVHWQPSDQHDYTLRFSDRNEPTANPFKVNHGASNSAHSIRGHSGCDSIHDHPGEFYCKYSLTRDNESTPCADPGLHIVP